LSKDKSKTKVLSKSTKTVSKKKIGSVFSKKRQTETQNQTPQMLLDKNPNFEKLHPELYAKLQSTINEVIEKTVPEYKK